MKKSLAFVLCLACAGMAAGPEYERARKLYNKTDYDQSLKVLQSIPHKDAAVLDLMGRDYYMQGDYRKAGEAFEKAFAADPGNAEAALWLGRSYGRRAETSSPFTAPGYASRARQYFEKSVQLNPNDLEAWSDLFEYYLEAPGLLGGGLDKAQGVAERMGKINPSEGAWAQAKIAERRKQYGAAEEHLRQAADLAPQQVGKLIELARLLVKQGRIQEADQSLARAESIAPNNPRLLYAKADIYIKGGRNLDMAKDLLKRYLACNLTPEDPPRSDAEKLLRRAQGNGL